MNENKIITNADRLRAMSTDELAEFFANKATRGGEFIAMADHYICSKCKKEHDGKCPVDLDENPCLHDLDETQTIKYWLEGAAE